MPEPNTHYLIKNLILLTASEGEEKGIPEFVVQEAVGDWVGAGGEVGQHRDQCVQLRVPDVECLMNKNIFFF